MVRKLPKIDWIELATIRFRPKTPDMAYMNSLGTCGTFAIHCLTGEPVSEIARHCPKKGWWDDNAVRRYLKKRGYETIPFNLEDIHASKPYEYRNNVNHQHVLLMSTHASDEEGTWQVVYNNRVYHGAEVEFFSGYEVLINPVWTMYLVWHPKWKSSKKSKIKNQQIQLISHTKDDLCWHPLTGKWYNAKKKKIENPS
jgi:hypothetical protein